MKRKEEDQKMRWLDLIKNDMRAAGVCVGDVENQDKRTRAADFK